MFLYINIKYFWKNRGDKKYLPNYSIIIIEYIIYFLYNPIRIRSASNPANPFEPKELLLRIKNILNKTKKFILPDEFYIGKALINLKKLHIKINNKTIKINPQEKKVLEKMLEIPGKIFSRNDIGKIISISKERSIDVMITRLRQKIESNPKNPKYLQTIRGSGYALWVE